ncbi:MAG TPA: hypothetical protein VJG32_11780 [Anaerolineae bacterium]|nr:hypothetical protein [Anaerolineae bacterium]
MDERDRLLMVVDKLGSDQLRILARFAEIIAEEQQADPMHDTSDVRTRYEQFKQWCSANSLDLDTVEAWVHESRRVRGRAASDDQPAAQAK